MLDKVMVLPKGKRADQLVEIPKCKFTRTALIMASDMTKEEWEILGEKLHAMQGAVHLWLGDWLQFGEKKNYIGRDRYDLAAELTGYSRETLQNDAYVAGKIPVDLRDARLTFTHWTLLVGLALAKIRKWRDLVIKNEWPVAELRRQLLLEGEWSDNKKRLANEPHERLLQLALEDFKPLAAKWARLEEVADIIVAINTFVTSQEELAIARAEAIARIGKKQ